MTMMSLLKINHPSKWVIIAWIDPNPAVTSTPAMNTPMVIKLIALQYFTPNRYAIRLPVHPPDPGSGIETKIIKNTCPYFENFSLCLSLVLSNSFSQNLSSVFECFLRSFVTGFSSFRMKKIGMIFPIVPITKASIGERPIPIPSGIPKRSSSPGSIELKNVVISGVRSSWIMWVFTLLAYLTLNFGWSKEVL